MKISLLAQKSGDSSKISLCRGEAMPKFQTHKDGFFVRDACTKDLDDICKLGALLNTINLPSSKSELEQVIILSERSFSLEESDPAGRCYLFALVDAYDRVI